MTFGQKKSEDVHLEGAGGIYYDYFLSDIIYWIDLFFVMDSDGDIEVGELITDVGAEKTLVSPDII